MRIYRGFLFKFQKKKIDTRLHMFDVGPLLLVPSACFYYSPVFSFNLWRFWFNVCKQSS